MLGFIIGLGGAFCYAGPKLLADIRSGKHWRISLAEGLMALLLGSGFSAAFAPWLGFHWRWLAQPDDTALRVVIGLTGNPAAPYITGLVMARIKGISSQGGEQ